MDIRMPRMDGLAAARQICQFDPSARVVMVTDYDDEGLRAAARDAGRLRLRTQREPPGSGPCGGVRSRQ